MPPARIDKRQSRQAARNSGEPRKQRILNTCLDNYCLKDYYAMIFAIVLEAGCYGC